MAVAARALALLFGRPAIFCPTVVAHVRSCSSITFRCPTFTYTNLHSAASPPASHRKWGGFTSAPGRHSLEVRIKNSLNDRRNADAEAMMARALDRKDFLLLTRCFTALVEGYLQQGNIDKALQWLDKMEQHSVVPSVGLLCVLLDSFAKLKNLTKVREFAVRITDHPKMNALNVRSYNSIISGFSRIDDIDSARRYFDRMIAAGVRPNQISFCTLIGAYARVNRVEEAFGIYDQMVTEHQQQPDLHTYVTLIKTCRHRPELKPRAFMFFEEMRSRGIMPNHAVYHALLTVCTKTHDYAKAAEVWKHLHEQGLIPNLILYNTMLGVFGRDQLEAAEQLFTELLRNGFVPTTVTFNMMIKCAAMNHNFSKAREYFERLRDALLIPDEYSFNGLLSSVRNLEDLPQAETYYRDMRMKGLCPNVVVLNALARVAAGHDDSKARFFLNEIQALGLQPDSATYAVVTKLKQSERAQASVASP